MKNFDKRQKNKAKALFFIALLPDEKIYREIQQIKQQFSDHYGPRQALKSPPHITLHMPFLWKENAIEQLTVVLQEFSQTHRAPVIEIEGFNAFPPRVIFLGIKQNDLLDTMQSHLVSLARKSLKLDNSNYKDQGFHPHITIAYRDLKKPVFVKAWNHYKDLSYQRCFIGDKLTLLKHNDLHWDIFTQFPFKA